MNRIYIVLYLNSIQPSRFKHTYNELNLYTAIYNWFIHVQNAYLNMSVNESHEQNLYCVIF